MLLIRNNVLLNLLKKADITPPEFIAPKFFKYVVTQHQINDNLDNNEVNRCNNNETKLDQSSTKTIGKDKSDTDHNGALDDNDKKVFRIKHSSFQETNIY